MTTTSRSKPKSLSVSDAPRTAHLQAREPDQTLVHASGPCHNLWFRPRPERLQRRPYGSNRRQGTTRIRLRRYRPATARVFSPYLVDSLKLMEEASSKYRVLAGTSATRNPKWIACMSSSESKLKPRELR